MKIQLQIELGNSWNMYSSVDEQTILLELLKTNFDDVAILDIKKIE